MQHKDTENDKVMVVLNKRPFLKLVSVFHTLRCV